MAKRIVYYGKKDLEGLRWTAKVIEFGVGLEVSAAFNEMTCAMVCLRENAKLWKHEVKYRCNEAMRLASIRADWIRKNMANKSFWNDYSDYIIDAAGQDITMFRISIKQSLDDVKHPYSELFAYVECARVLLEMSVEQFKYVMEESEQRFGRDYSGDFKEYCAADVLFQWDKMCLLLYKGYKCNLNTDRTQKAFDVMIKKFVNGEHVDACLAEAQRTNPEFVKNEIVVKE